MKKSAIMKQDNTNAIITDGVVDYATYQDQVQELSYYKIKLIAFMANAHPRYIEQNQFTPQAWEEFLATRADAAEIEAEKCIREGLPQYIAEDYAIEVLLAGLRFSPHLAIMEILDSVYPNVKPGLSVENIYAIEDACASVVDKYTLGDDYVTDPLYGDLMEELRGCVHKFLINTDLEISIYNLPNSLLR